MAPPLAKAEPANDPALASTSIDERRGWRWAAYVLWIAPALVIAGLFAASPFARSVTPIYRIAAENWLAQRPLYTGPAGFNYLPSFPMLFSLLTPLPPIAGDILWRWLAFAGLACGLWRHVESMSSADRRHRDFVLATLLSLPIAISALRNGQSSAHLAACLVLAATCLHRQQWWKGSWWLCLSLICKPLGIVAIGLAVAAYPRVRARVFLGTLVVLAIPFLAAPAHYVAGIYADFFANLVDCFDTGRRTFADINGVLMPFGLTLRGFSSLAVRVSLALLFAIAGARLVKYGSHIHRSMLWLALTACYIMLFTPMNEANSYVMLAPGLGLWAVWYKVHRFCGRTAIVAAISSSVVLLPSWVGALTTIDNGNQFAKFWNPFMTLFFLALLSSDVIGRSKRFATPDYA